MSQAALKRTVLEALYQESPFVRVLLMTKRAGQPVGKMPEWAREDPLLVLLVGFGCARPPLVQANNAGLLFTGLTRGSEAFEVEAPWDAVVQIVAATAAPADHPPTCVFTWPTDVTADPEPVPEPKSGLRSVPMTSEGG